MRRRLPIAAAFAASILATILTFRLIPLQNDITAFLPRGDTPAARFMLGRLRTGAASGVLLIGLENAPPEQLARVATRVADSLRASGAFGLVAGAGEIVEERQIDLLFRYRYLLSASTTPAAFATERLSADLKRLVEDLNSSASPLAGRFGLADPTGAFTDLTRAWLGGQKVRMIDGVWFAPTHDRALLVARLRGGGMDLAVETRGVRAVRAAFAAARPGDARLSLSGPAVFAHDAALRIKSDVERLSLLSSLAVATLLLWRFRSPWVVAVIAIPVLLSLDIAAIVTRLAFGGVQGAAFGFGMTMLGVTVDYPVLLVGHRKRSEAPAGTIRRIGAPLTLTVLGAAFGLLGMLGSGLPGLRQIGLFSVAGVLAAGAITRFALPALIADADLAPAAAGENSWMLRLEGLRRGRVLALAPAAAAIAFLLLHPPHWGDTLLRLSPVPEADRALDASLRADLGADEEGWMGVIEGPDAETVLQAEERIAPAGESAARYLPSAATQRARQAALPTSAILADRLRIAEAGLPFRAEAFSPFLADVAASRLLPPLALSDLPPRLRARLEPLIFFQDERWYGLTRLPTSSAPRGLTTINPRLEADFMLDRATRHAWRWLGWGAAAGAALLALGLRDLRRWTRVAGCVGASTLVTVGALDALGTSFSLLQIVALQFVAGIGLDYALFFSRPRLDAEERARTWRTLTTCNGMSLLTFGLLATCRTPLLREIGLAVALGAAGAMAHAFLLAAPGRDRA